MSITNTNDNINQLYNWLATLELSQYYDLFNENDITFDLLPSIDKSTLKEIGISKVGDIIKLSTAIKELKLHDLARYIQLNDLLKILQDDNIPQQQHQRQRQHSQSKLSSTGASSSNASSNANITFILQDGSSKKISVEGCFNAESIKRKVLKKLNMYNGNKSTNWDTYSIDENDQLHLMFDVELITVCHSNDEDLKIDKNRIILCPQGETPSLLAIETSQKITSKLNLLNKKKKPSSSRIAEQQSTTRDSQLRDFLGQRPPSELISSNLLEYFPNTKVNDLQETVRNSVRMSRFMSTSRFSMLSLSRPASIVSSRISPQSSNHNRTIGDAWMNSNTLRDDTTLRSSRVSVISSIDNRTSTVELFDEDEDYGNDEDLIDDTILSQLSLEEETGPTNWLKGAKIGSGSFGVVYLGMNSLTGELMAVKQVEIPRESLKNPNMLMIDALKQEMSLLKNLQHDNIVRYIGSNSDSQFLNIFLEYVPGGSVTTMLNNYGPFEEPLIRNFVRQILIGLNYLHGEHIIHRDIKGANVLIDIKGTVKISDFGISKKISPTSSNEPVSNKRSSLQGSVYWMAPEVVKQTAYTPKLDIWSVGCLIVEMFTGKHPFPDFSQMQLIFKIGTHTRPSIPLWATDELKLFLDRTFELDYLKRPNLAELLRDEFLNTLIMSKK